MIELFVIAGIGWFLFANLGGVYTAETFVKKLYPIARQIQAKYGIKAEYLITQAALESNYGNSGLTKQAFNLFGMKWDKKHNWIEMKTKEYENGKEVQIVDRFNRYNSWTEACEDYAIKISTLVIYRGVYNQSKMGTVDNWAWELAVSPYATDPNYKTKLVARYNAIKKYFA